MVQSGDVTDEILLREGDQRARRLQINSQYYGGSDTLLKEPMSARNVGL